MAVLRAARAVRHAFNMRLRAVGLSMTEASLLNFLDEHGSLTQRELADLLKISAASAGSAVDALEKRSLVERRPDPTDRRVWRVVLAAAATAFVEEFKRVDDELQSAFRAGLSRHDRQVLAQLLAVLEENAGRAVTSTTVSQSGTNVA